MDSGELTSVMKELDELTIRMLDLMKEYLHVKLTLQKVIKNGSLHLAKSRYIMGNRNVSALQLPTEDSNEFKAATKVVSKKENSSDDVVFELSKLSIKDREKSVRSRHSKKENDQTNNDNEHKIQDPLKWFGLLVPQNMRQAQVSFSEALEYVIQGANIQLEMDQLKVLYNLKLKKKQELLQL